MTDVLTAREAGLADAPLLQRFYEENLTALHGVPIPLTEWQGLFTPPDPDERHYILLSGGEPVGWFRINGLEDRGGRACLAMLVVGRDFHRRGAGRFAVDFAQRYAREHGYAALGIYTTGDNLPAQALYASCGFALVDRGPRTTPDGAEVGECVFEKALTSCKKEGKPLE